MSSYPTTTDVCLQWIEMGIEHGFFNRIGIPIIQLQQYLLSLDQYQLPPPPEIRSQQLPQQYQLPPPPPPEFRSQQPMQQYQLPPPPEFRSQQPMQQYQLPPPPEFRSQQPMQQYQLPPPPEFRSKQPTQQYQSQPSAIRSQPPPSAIRSPSFIQDYQRPGPIRMYGLQPDHNICIDMLKNKECPPTCQKDHSIYRLFKNKQCKYYLDKNCKFVDPVMCSHLHGDDPYDPEKRNYNKRRRYDE